MTVLLGRTEDTAVGITRLEAFSTGFRFTLAVRLRQARRELAHGGLHTLLSTHVHMGIEVPLPKRLMLGIEYANGHRASTLHDMRTHGPATADGHELVLAPQGGSADDRSADQTYWVSPLPPAGPMTFVLTWPAFNIPESRVQVDSAPIRAAADHSQPLWPPQPAAEPPEPPPPPRPTSGWFAEPHG